MYVHFLKRLAPVMTRFNDRIIACAKADSTENKKRKNESNGDHSTPGGCSGSANQGQLLPDATCTPVDITYPADLKLLNEARQDELDRIPVEGKFGQGKRRFGLARTMAKLAATSITASIISAVVMRISMIDFPRQWRIGS